MRRLLLAILLAVLLVTMMGALPTYAESPYAAYYTWDNIDEFIDWYHSENFTIIMSVGDRPANCVDYAMMVQRAAMKDGKLVSVALDGGAGTYYDQWVSYPYHAGNLVLVPGGAYWIEPRPDKFRVVRLTGLVY